MNVRGDFLKDRFDPAWEHFLSLSSAAQSSKRSKYFQFSDFWCIYSSYY